MAISTVRKSLPYNSGTLTNNFQKEKFIYAQFSESISGINGDQL